MSTKSKARAEERARKFHPESLPAAQEHAVAELAAAMLNAFSLGMLEVEDAPSSRRM